MSRSGHQVCAPTVACETATKVIDCRSRLGVAPALNGEPGLTESGGARHVVEMRARRILEARIRFVGYPDFEDSTATDWILGPRTGPAGRGTGSDSGRDREALPFCDADFQDGKFLTREQEVHLFRRMNFLKYQAAKLHEAIIPSLARSADLDRIEELLREAGAIRNRIIRSYLGLVVSIAKRFTGTCQDNFDMVSEGNFTLIRAAEQFDFGRGARFSTYATWAITNDFVRRFPTDRRRRVQFATGREGLLQILADHRDNGGADAIDQEQSRYIIRKMLDTLSVREQTILVRRFGLAGDEQTLTQVGRQLGISKERVRQLESRALDRLRAQIEVQKLDPTDESS